MEEQLWDKWTNNALEDISFEMKLQRLESVRQERLNQLDRMNKKMKDLEHFLKSGMFPSIEYMIEDCFLLKWNYEKGRLMIYDEGMYVTGRPLLECKLEVREKIYPYLDSFIECFMKKYNESFEEE